MLAKVVVVVDVVVVDEVVVAVIGGTVMVGAVVVGEIVVAAAVAGGSTAPDAPEQAVANANRPMTIGNSRRRAPRYRPDRTK